MCWIILRRNQKGLSRLYLLTRWQVRTGHPDVIPDVVVPDRVNASVRVIGVEVQIAHVLVVVFIH